VRYRGGWNGSTSYVIDDLVTDSGSTWRAVHANTDSEPGGENDDWEIFARRGQDGADGATGAMYAVVDEDGGISRIYPTGGGFTADRLSTGTYEVRFGGIDITACAYIGTIGSVLHLGPYSPGFITVVGRAGADDGVFVQTFSLDDSSASPADMSFHLAVICSPDPGHLDDP
jgi:hypothetical protein